MIKIIAVDDNPDVLCILTEMLRHEYEVITTENPEAVLSMLEGVRLVITDREMTPINGFQLATLIKSHPHPPKVLMITGGASDEDIETATLCGIDGYLAKPFFKAPLLAVVHSLLS